MAPEPMKLPDDPNDLVALILDGSQPKEVVNQAWEKLLPTIQSIAKLAARKAHWSRDQLETFVAESPGLIYTALRKGRYNREERVFRAWAKKVLHRKAIDFLRKTSRTPWKVMSDFNGGQSEPEGDEEEQDSTGTDPTELVKPRRKPGEGEVAVGFQESLCNLAQRIRSCLDQVSQPASRTVDYFAALLLLLRVQALNILSAEVLLENLYFNCEALIIWKSEEELRQMHRDHPKLIEMWRKITTQQIQGLSLEELHQFIVARFSVKLSYTTLAMWFHRAKDKARKILGEERWRECGFDRLTTFRGGGEVE